MQCRTSTGLKKTRRSIFQIFAITGSSLYHITIIKTKLLPRQLRFIVYYIFLFHFELLFFSWVYSPWCSRHLLNSRNSLN